MHIVSAILRRTLLQHIPIAIEGIGTLRTVRSGARFLPGQRLEPPRRMPELVPTETGDLTLTDLVATQLSTDLITAGGLCREWREQAFTQAERAGQDEDSMLMEAVGTVRLNPAMGTEFYADAALLELLNPLPGEPLVVPAPSVHRRPLPTAPMPTTSPAGPRRQRKPPRIKPKGKNPHNYTVSFLAVLVALAALSYFCYYLWAHTELFSDLLTH